MCIKVIYKFILFCSFNILFLWPVSKWNGAWLNMSSVERGSSGAYFCIASNGVPPSVSKRVLLRVLCKINNIIRTFFTCLFITFIYFAI